MAFLLSLLRMQHTPLQLAHATSGRQQALTRCHLWFKVSSSIFEGLLSHGPIFFYHVLYICPHLHTSPQWLIELGTLSQHRFCPWDGMPSSCGPLIIHGKPEPTQEIPAICLVSELTLISITVNISQNLACPDPRVPLLSKHSLGRQTVSVLGGDNSGTVLEWEHICRGMSHIHIELGHIGLTVCHVYI